MFVHFRNRIPLLIFFLFIAPPRAFSQAGQPAKDWKTTFETSGFYKTSRYPETMFFFRKLEQVSPYARLKTIGVSPQGREIQCLIVSKDRAFTPQDARKTGKPVFMILNGIHSGEIEGKDACMLLLREILVTKEKKNLLDNVTLLVVPIFSVDGHERFAPFNRINQNGPEEMGWRTTAQNLNLNRDWLKADAPEMRALLAFISRWLPDFFIDTHTTDGADFQYSAMYGIEKYQNMYGPTASFINDAFIPFLTDETLARGFLIAPYVGFRDGDVYKGIVDWPGTPRFSTGYFAARNRIALLIETHMLKPYKERVFATKAMIEASLHFTAKNKTRLLQLNKEADIQSAKLYARGHEAFPVLMRNTYQSGNNFFFKGIRHRKENSIISGTEKITFTGETFADSVPFFNSIKIIDSVRLPFAYIIPPEWSLLAERLRLHGVKIYAARNSFDCEATSYRFKNVKFASAPYEGRQTVACDYDNRVEKTEIPEGSFIVPTEQSCIRIIAHALEPKSADSFLRWGFMNAIFEQKEYFEDYVMEKTALEMIEKDPSLKEEFFNKVATDTAFAQSPGQRLEFFYKRSPYFDKKMNQYPILRIESPINDVLFRETK